MLYERGENVACRNTFPGPYTFKVFVQKLLAVARRYPIADALIPPMSKRMEAGLAARGAMTSY